MKSETPYKGPLDLLCSNITSYNLLRVYYVVATVIYMFQKSLNYFLHSLIKVDTQLTERDTVK